MKDEYDSARFIILHSSFCISPGGIFLLHFPSDCSASPLATTVPYAVRTFLAPRLARGAIATAAREVGLNSDVDALLMR